MKSLISIASLKSRSFNVLKLNFERNKRNCNCNVILSMLSPHSYLGTLSHKVNDARHNRPSNSICVWNETMCNARASPKQMLEELCGSNIVALRFGDHDLFQIARNNSQQHATTCNRVCKRTQHVTANNVVSVCTGL